MRLATFNILHGRSSPTGWSISTGSPTRCASLDADILALQEVDRDQPRSHLADLTAVAAEAMGAVTQRFVAALSGTPGATWMAATGTDVPGSGVVRHLVAVPLPGHELAGAAAAAHPVRFPMWLPGPRKVDRGARGAAAVVIGQLETPAVPGGGQHAPLVRSRLGPAAAGPDAAGPGRRAPIRWC